MIIMTKEHDQYEVHETPISTDGREYEWYEERPLLKTSLTDSLIFLLSARIKE